MSEKPARRKSRAGRSRENRVLPPAQSHEQAYNTLLTSMELLDVRFTRAAFEAPRIFVGEKGRQLDAAVETDGSYFNFGSGFIAVAVLRFKAQYKDEDEPSITAEAELELLFRSPIPMTEEHFEIFKARNLQIYSRPYFREFLHSAITRTGWPAYTLPPLTFEPVKQDYADPTAEELSE